MGRDPLSEKHWYKRYFKIYIQISGEFETILSKPILFAMTNGEIHSAKISKEEPVWSVNFKKALALQFQTKYDVSLSEEEENNMVKIENKYMAVCNKLFLRLICMSYKLFLHF